MLTAAEERENLEAVNDLFGLETSKDALLEELNSLRSYFEELSKRL